MKTRVIALMLCLCVMLSACAVVPGQTQGTNGNEQTGQEPTWQPDNGEPPIQTEKEFVKAVYDELPEEDCYYRYGNMQKANADENFVIYGDEVLFVGGDISRLYAYDLTTGKARRFCNIPDCDHTSSACRVLGLARPNLESYDGKLYTHFYNTPVKVLEDSEWKSMGIRADHAWHAYGDLFTVQAGRLKFYDDGVGEPRTILNDYDYLFNVVVGRYLYSHSCSGLVRVDLMADNPSKEVVMEEVFCMVAEDCIYYVDNTEGSDTYYLYRCDLDGSNSELLLDKPVLPASLNFDDEYLYFRLFTDYKIKGTEDSKDIYRMSKADPAKVEKIATLDKAAYMIFTAPGQDVLFVITYGTIDSDGRVISDTYVMKRDGSGLTLLELP